MLALITPSPFHTESHTYAKINLRLLLHSPPPASFYQTTVVMLVATTTQAEKVKHVKDPIKTAGEMKKKMTSLAHPKTRSNIRSKRNREETMSRKTKKSRFLERES